MPRLLLAALLLAAGCSEAPTVSDCVPGLDPDCDPPVGEPEVVAGVDLTALLAVPTTAEVDVALDSLEALAADAPGASTTPLGAEADGARRFRLSIEAEGQRVATALARVPGPAGATTALPAVVVLTDGTDGASEADLLTDAGYGALAGGAVQVVLAYRGEALSLPEGLEASAAAPDPYRADVADVVAVLEAVRGLPRVDSARVGLVGVGRGGTVALLAALAGADVEAVVALGAPTDLFSPSFRDVLRTALRGGTSPSPPPAVEALVAPALALRDGEASLETARLGLLGLSPARLRAPDRLPSVLALHAAGDEAVGEDHLLALAAALGTAPGRVRVADVVEGVSRASLPDAPSVQNRVATFLLGEL